MIIFHEGLPGAGKSYGAMADHIIPALRKGRRVFCYIEGLDFARIAEVASITELKCRELLVQLTRDQIPTIYSVVENDSLVVIDELQNFFPDTRQPLDADMTEFVTEHRHRGLDILAMGQLLKDCHKIWRNRTSQKVTFHQLDTRGKPDHYKWTVYKGRLDARGNVQFDEVNKGSLKYDRQYFGTYASHTEGTDNKSTFQDARANIWNNPILKRHLPMYGGILVFGVAFLFWAFAGGGLAKSLDGSASKQAVSKPSQMPVPVPGGAQAAPPVAQAAPGAVTVSDIKGGRVVGTHVEVLSANQIQPALQADYIDELCSSYRIRLTGIVRAGRHTSGLVEWRDEAGSVKEMLSLRDVSGLGWLLLISPDGTIGTLQKGERRYVVSAWPLQDYRGTVNAEKTKEIKGDGAESIGVVAAPARVEGAGVSKGGGVVTVPGNDSTNPKFNGSLRG